jgi:hypothetical protein
MWSGKSQAGLAILVNCSDSDHNRKQNEFAKKNSAFYTAAACYTASPSTQSFGFFSV